MVARDRKSALPLNGWSSRDQRGGGALTSFGRRESLRRPDGVPRDNVRGSITQHQWEVRNENPCRTDSGCILVPCIAAFSTTDRGHPQFQELQGRFTRSGDDRRNHLGYKPEPALLLARSQYQKGR